MRLISRNVLYSTRIYIEDIERLGYKMIFRWEVLHATTIQLPIYWLYPAKHAKSILLKTTKGFGLSSM